MKALLEAQSLTKEVEKPAFFERVKKKVEMTKREIIAIVIAGLTLILAIVLPRILMSGESASPDAVAIINAIYAAMGIEVGVLTAIIFALRR